MQYTTLGRTGLRVSVAGLGTGGFSRLGLKTGKTEEQSARLIHEAVELGVNFIDTAPSYGTEGVVGQGAEDHPARPGRDRDQGAVPPQQRVVPPEQVVASLDNSLRLMGTDHVDVFNLHGVEIARIRLRAGRRSRRRCSSEKQKGKIRHIGITENPIVDFTNAMLKRALHDPVWEVFMVGFHMMHQGARQNVFPVTREKGIGTLLMFAVRSIFADPPRVAREMQGAGRQGAGREMAGRERRSARLSRPRGRRGEHDRGGLSVRAARAGRRRGAVRHRRRRASAHQRRLAAQAAAAGGGSREAREAVRAPDERHRARFPQGAGLKGWARSGSGQQAWRSRL